MAKEFKRRNDNNSSDNRSNGPGKKKYGKKEKKRSFNRFRDDSRPSDFDTTQKESARFDKPKSGFNKKPAFKKDWNKPGKPSFQKAKGPANPYDLDEKDFEYEGAEENKPRDRFKKNSFKKSGPRRPSSPSSRENDGSIRLNKYLSNAGICSRREADELIASGVVQVNGKTITEMGFRVKPTDIVKYGGQTLRKERMVYLILNKPKDYITTLDDPQKRKTVLELIHGACKERIYPVGRLDRATTGLLMFTNDGELTKKLTHPRYGVRKIYHVELDKPLKPQDMQQIAEGVELEDGLIKVDEISYAGDGKNRKEVGVELHSGKNRIVRRIFEHLGYNVRKLDRVIFGPLSKKDLPRGRWRFLTPAEVGMLNMIGEK